MRLLGGTLRRIGPPLVAFAALVGLFELIAVHNPYVIPNVGSIVGELAHHKELFFDDARTTLLESVVGLALGFSAAFVLAIVMDQIRVLERALMPLAIALNVTPLVALAPGLAVALGVDTLAPRYVVAAIIVFFPFLINLTAGLRSVEAGALEVLRTIGASRLEILRRLQLPSSLPFLFSGARICFPLSLVGAVVAELTVSSTASGLGYLIVESSGDDALAPIYAAVVCLAVIGALLYGIVVVTERRALGWYRATRGVRDASAIR